MKDTYLIFYTDKFYPVPVGSLLLYSGHEELKDGRYICKAKIIGTP